MVANKDEEPMYIFDALFGDLAPAMLDGYEIPQYFREDFFSVLDADTRPDFRWLVIGPARSGASWHVDPSHTAAWNALIRGRKRWALYPPGRLPPGITVEVRNVYHT